MDIRNLQAVHFMTVVKVQWIGVFTKGNYISNVIETRV